MKMKYMMLAVIALMTASNGFAGLGKRSYFQEDGDSFEDFDPNTRQKFNEIGNYKSFADVLGKRVHAKREDDSFEQLDPHKRQKFEKVDTEESQEREEEMQRREEEDLEFTRELTDSYLKSFDAGSPVQEIKEQIDSFQLTGKIHQDLKEFTDMLELMERLNLRKN